MRNLFSTLLGVLIPGFLPVHATAAIDVADGNDLARRMRDMRPGHGVTNTAVIQIRRAQGERFEVPVLIRTIVTETNWQTFYSTTTSPTLVVVQTHDHPSEYKQLRPVGVGTDADLRFAMPLNSAFITLAGSDFWLFDLGLEFLQWPRQQLSGTDTRKGQKCYLLDSVNPQTVPGRYSRVRSWVDMDTLGIVHAEAFDHLGRVLKVFDPKSFEKVNGRWRLKEMEMRNEQTESRSRLIFDRTLE